MKLDSQAMPLAAAEKMAEKIAEQLRPFCERLEIAGSIRRKRPVCNDIDLVILPKDLAGLRLRLVAHKDLTKVTDGPMNIIVRLGNGVQLDIFLAEPERKDLVEARPTNFGSLLLCRTGSTEHNIFIVGKAKKLGMRWNPYFGVFDNLDGRCLAAATEEEIFKVLGMEFVPPEKRER